MKDMRLKELTEKLRSGQDVSPEEVDEIFEAAKESAQNGLSRKEIPELFTTTSFFLKTAIQQEKLSRSARKILSR